MSKCFCRGCALCKRTVLAVLLSGALAGAGAAFAGCGPDSVRPSEVDVTSDGPSTPPRFDGGVLPIDGGVGLPTPRGDGATSIPSTNDGSSGNSDAAEPDPTDAGGSGGGGGQSDAGGTGNTGGTGNMGGMGNAGGGTGNAGGGTPGPDAGGPSPPRQDAAVPPPQQDTAPPPPPPKQDTAPPPPKQDAAPPPPPPARDTAGPPPEPSTKYEFEDGQLEGATVSAQRAGFSGSGYIVYGGFGGGKVQLSVSTGVAGSHAISIHYNNSGRETPNLAVQVNGGAVQNVGAGPTGYFDWGSVQVQAQLGSGTNTISISATVMGADLDYIGLRPPQ